jgi:hypothetical protein
VKANDECVLPEIRLWRVAHAMHANIPRSVVRQPAVMEHRPEHQVPGRRELLDLSLNILNLFVPPKRGALDDLQPLKCFRGFCSAFAAQQHERFAREFIDALAETGGAIPSERIRVWIDAQRAARVALERAAPLDRESMAASA